VDDVLGHAFFADLNQEKLLMRKLEAEFIPTIDSTGINNFDTDITNEKPEESMVPAEVIKKI
jgi:hypothetical protein